MFRTRGGHCRPCGASPGNIFRPPAIPARARARNIRRKEQTSAPARSDRSRREILSRGAPGRFVSASVLFPGIIVLWPFRNLRRLLSQISIQSVKLHFPKRAVLGNPCFSLLQRPRGEPAATRSPVL